MGQRRGNGQKNGGPREPGGGNGSAGGRIMERLIRTLRVETSIPPNLVPEVIEDLLGLISSELEGVAPDVDVEVALSPGQLREQILEWGYREDDISEEDVDRILSRLIHEMARLGTGSSP